MFLKSIKIKNYKGLKDIEINDLSGLNALIGPNMAGKSTVLDALLFIREGASINFKDALEKRGGFKSIANMQNENQNIEIELLFEVEKSFRDNLLLNILRKDFESSSTEARIYNSYFLKKLKYRLEFKLINRNNSTFQESLYTPNIIDEKTELKIIEYSKNRDRTMHDWRLVTTTTQLQKQIYDLLSGKIEILGPGSEPSSWGPWDQNYTNLKLLFSNFQNVYNKLEDEIILHFVKYIDNIKWLGPHKNILNRVKISTPLNLLSDASNLAGVIRHMRTNETNKFEEFSKQVSYVIPEIITITTPMYEDESTTSISEDKKIFHTLENLSAGTKNVLSIIAILINSKDNDLVLIEEPESHLHPIAIRKLADILKNYSLTHQIILTTHSPTILYNFNANDKCFLIKRHKENTSTIEIKAKNFYEIVEALGILPSDILEHNKVVFLEGECDDEIWKAFRMGKDKQIKDICYVPTHGWKQAIIYAGIELLKNRKVKPSIFVVWDGDLDRKVETKKAKKKMVERLTNDFDIKDENILTLPKGEIECYLLDVEAWFKTWPKLEGQIEKEELKAEFNKILESTEQKEKLEKLMSKLELGHYTKEIAAELAKNIEGIPKDIEYIFKKFN